MRRRRHWLAVAAVLSVGVAACADDSDGAARPADPPSSTTTGAVSSTSPATTTSDASNPTTTAPATSSPPGTFEIPEPPAELRNCDAATDLFTQPAYVESPSDLAVEALFVVNVSPTACGLPDPGFIARGLPVRLGDALDWRAGPASLAPGDVAVFVVSAVRSSSFDTDDYDYLTLVLGDDELETSLYSSLLDVSFVGPVEWTGPPHPPAVFVPADAASGTPIAPDAVVTTAGVGAFRAGMSPQEVADATGSVFVVTEWGVASPGCGYGSIPPDLRFTLDGTTDSPADAVVGAVDRAGDRRTPSGLGIGSSVAEVREALGDDRLSTFLNEYTGADDYLFTPRDPGEQHLGVFFRIDPETDTVAFYEAGLRSQIGRAEGCA